VTWPTPGSCVRGRRGLAIHKLHARNLGAAKGGCRIYLKGGFPPTYSGGPLCPLPPTRDSANIMSFPAPPYDFPNLSLPRDENNCTAALPMMQPVSGPILPSTNPTNILSLILSAYNQGLQEGSRQTSLFQPSARYGVPSVLFQDANTPPPPSRFFPFQGPDVLNSGPFPISAFLPLDIATAQGGCLDRATADSTSHQMGAPVGLFGAVPHVFPEDANDIRMNIPSTSPFAVSASGLGCSMAQPATESCFPPVDATAVQKPAFGSLHTHTGLPWGGTAAASTAPYFPNEAMLDETTLPADSGLSGTDWEMALSLQFLSNPTTHPESSPSAPSYSSPIAPEDGSRRPSNAPDTPKRALPSQTHCPTLESPGSDVSDLASPAATYMPHSLHSIENAEAPNRGTSTASNVSKNMESQQDYLHASEGEAVQIPADTDASNRIDPLDTSRANLESGDQSPANGDTEAVSILNEEARVLSPAVAHSTNNDAEPPTESFDVLSESSAQSPACASSDVIDTPDVQQAGPDKESPTEPLDSLSQSPVGSPLSADDDVTNTPNPPEAESNQGSHTDNSGSLAGTLSVQGPAKPPRRSDIDTATENDALVEGSDDSLPPLQTLINRSKSRQRCRPGDNPLPIELSSDEDQPHSTRKRQRPKTSPSQARKRRKARTACTQQPRSADTVNFQLKRLTYIARESNQERCLAWCQRSRGWRDTDRGQRLGAVDAPDTPRIMSLSGRLDNGIFLCLRGLNGSWQAYDEVGRCRYEAKTASVELGLSEGQVVCQRTCNIEDSD
jgi:hypothetical protein